MDALRWVSGVACGATLLVGLFSIRRGWTPPWLREDPRAYGWFMILLSGGMFTAWVALDQEEPTRKVLNSVALLLVGIAYLVYLALRLIARHRRAAGGDSRSAGPV